MTEEALAAPAAPAPAPAEAAEAAPAKTEAKTEEGGDAGAAAAAPKTAGADATAPAAPTTAPIQTQEAAAAAGDADAEAEAAKKDPAPADSVISARLRELLEETDLEKTSVRQLRATLESEFNCDLGSHKVLLRKTVDAFLAEKQPKEEEEEEEEEAEEAEEAASSSSSSSEEEEPAPKKAKASAAKGKGKGGGGFQKPLKLSSEMAAFTREEKLSRAQIVRKCWEYIKAENLQDPADKRKILVKGKLETIFTPPITMFSMNKQISKHVFPDED